MNRTQAQSSDLQISAGSGRNKSAHEKCIYSMFRIAGTLKNIFLGRQNVFAIFALVIFLLIILRMLFLAGSGGKVYRAEALAMASKNGELSAIRGRIYASNGRLSVWSERSYDLLFKSSALTPERRALLNNILQNTLDIDDLPRLLPAHPAVIKYNLTARELIAADQLSMQYPEFAVELRWERLSDHAISTQGEVRQINGMEYGISGLEKEYESRLRGTPGRFTVMLDRHGRWINSTFRIISPPVPGEDIFLNAAGKADYEPEK